LHKKQAYSRKYRMESYPQPYTQPKIEQVSTTTASGSSSRPAMLALHTVEALRLATVTA